VILAGDIGGTHCRLALAEVRDGRIKIICKQTYPSRLYDDLATIVASFLETHNELSTPIKTACFAVAGPVIDEVAQVTNLPWRLDARQLTTQLHIPIVRLINDFTGTAYGIEQLPADELVTIQPGEAARNGVRVLVGAGTGLGVGFTLQHDNRLICLPSEGGHVDFAPCDAQQIELLRYWQTKLPRVSYETFLSGKGIARLYEFVCLRDQGLESAALLQAADPAAAITTAAQQGDPSADRALAMFTEIYAAQAANLAITCLARGGVYLAGGIAPKIIDYLRSERFRTVFCDKPPMQTMLAAIPVQVIMNTDVGLLGAASLARSSTTYS